MGETVLVEKTKVKGLSGTTIKFIAIAAMLLDHIAWAFVPTYSVLGQVMHIIGRITASVMCFFIVEGYYHTRDIEKYILRLAVFAIISHVPFVFFETGKITLSGNTGVIYTLLLSLLSLIAYENIKSKPLKILAIVTLCFFSMMGDWMFIAILMTLNFARHRENFKKLAIGHILISVFTILILGGLTGNISGMLFQLGMVLALPLIYFYNGQKGEFSVKHYKFSKWLFYVFYPAHLIVLGIIKLYL